jgi:hypothetical protein
MFILTKEGITAIVRTLMGYVYGFLLTTFAFDLPAETETALTVLFGTGVYMLIRELAEKWPWVGNFLVVNKAPHYEEPTEPAA